MRVGSLCSGAGALDLAVETVFSAHTVWHCELEKLTDKKGKVRRNTAVDVLAAHWPGVPNHGDIETVDWDLVEPIDLLTAGYPCQPFSRAGKRKGADDERHIWPSVREAIRRLRPRYAFLENVAGHRSLGFDRVLGDLAEDGLHVRWTSLRAADVGSCHSRERLWILVTDPARNGWDEGWPESAGQQRGSDASVSGDGPVDLLPTPAASRSGRNQSPSPGAAIRPSLDMIGDLLPTPRSSDCFGPGLHGDGGMDLRTTVTLLQTPSAADALGGHLSRSGERGGEPLLPGQAREMATSWGKYEPAIRRWESLTRPAPSPTEPNTKGNPRLNPEFSSWMMGWPAGWVTDIPGISRNDQLRIIGNGVVPQCGSAALRWLLSTAMATA